MKPEGHFGLENAGWPALIVERTGTIRSANRSAVAFFGPVVDGHASLLSSIWARENEGSAEVFLSHWERAPAPLTRIHFKIKGGLTRMCPTHICAAGSAEARSFVFQLMPEAPAPTPAEATPPPSPARIEDRISAVESGHAQRQKLECALQLARTVALDFNNALTIILGHVSLVLRKLEVGSQWRKSLLEIQKAGEKAAEIANDLATFSRQEKPVRAQTVRNLNGLLRRTVEVFQRQCDSRVLWTLNLERNLCAANFDEAKLQQAIARILENAVQAIAINGRISVESRNIETPTPLRERNVDLPAGLYVCVEVSDNGSGIPPEVLPRVFEPFFTTKTDHRGLGLAWAYGIITNHGGAISVQSTPGQGTAVRVYLPATRRLIRDADVREEELSGSQTILVVDDEHLLLTLAQTVLSDYGYRVLTASSGKQALEVIAQVDRPIDLMITDLVMPQMSGRELIEQVQRFSPETSIIFMSGYVRPPGVDQDESFLRKPFTAQELLLKVKQALS